MNKSIDTSQALRTGWEVVKREWKILLLMYLVVLLAQWIPSFLADALDMAIISGLLRLAGWLLMMWTNFRVIRISLNLVDGKKVEVSDLWKDYSEDTSLFVQFIVASLLFGLAFFFGLVFLIIPGILVALAYGFYSYILVDERVDATDSLKMSKQLTKGARSQLFVFGLAMFLVNILGLLVFVVGIFVTSAVTGLASVAVYRQLQEQSMNPGVAQDHTALETQDETYAM